MRTTVFRRGKRRSHQGAAGGVRAPIDEAADARQRDAAPSGAAAVRADRVPADAFPPRELTAPELRLRAWLRAGALFYLAQAAAYVHYVFAEGPIARPFAINSAAKDVLFAALFWVAAANLRRFWRLIGLIVLGHLVLIALLAGAIVAGRSSSVFPPHGVLEFVFGWLGLGLEDQPLALWLGSDVVIVALLVWLTRRALRARYELRSLSPRQFETLSGIAEALFERPHIRPLDLARSVDHYWHDLRCRGKARLALALTLLDFYPLTSLRPTLSLMDAASRRDFLKRRLLPQIETRSALGPLRGSVQAAIRFAVQLIYSAYYSDRRTYGLTGYVPFSERGRSARLLSSGNGRGASNGGAARRESLDVTPPAAVADDELSADIVIVGTGAAGSTLAHYLLERFPDVDVLMIEGGRHVPSATFTEDERDMYKRLYSDGAVQLSRDFSVQVLQGMCVGGGTVVNNGVCFEPPDETLAIWSRPPFASGLTPAALRPALDDVRRLLRVEPLTHLRRNAAGRLMSGPAERLRERGALEGYGPVEANIGDDCFGCGYCNIGCPYGKKLSMLDWTLPRAQARHAGRLQIVSECRATRILRSGSTATGVRCWLSDGRGITVRARRALVLAAGAIHSSRLLLRSRIGGRQVGRGFGANVASFMTAEFDSRLDAFDALQLGDYVQPPRGAGYVIESIFNPVMTQSLLMPGWFEDHERNMSRYAHMTCAGVLLGTGRGNRVRRFADLVTSSEFDLTLTPGELERLLVGLKQAGSLLLEAGATRVMPATFHLVEMSRPEELARLDDVVRDPSDISLTTAHPQGGNAVSSDPRHGVVGPDLGVHGCRNLYVCDASVFPTPIGVNPQLTVMAVARLAAERLALS